MYAWVWCIFKDKKYLSGLFPSVYSLKTKYEKVLLYTSDIILDEKGEEDKQLLDTLSLFFDKLIKVEYIEVESKNLKTKKQNDKYKSWIDKSYTKWNLLTLTEYKKVMFVDCDVIFLKDVDNLFDLPTPSGTFSSPWGNRYLEGGFGIDINMYPTNHGDTISHNLITKTIKNNKNSVAVIGTMVLLEPNQKHFEMYMEYLQKNKPYGFRWCNSGFDEQSITMFYSEILKKDWYFIHQRYNYIPWKKNWLNSEDVPYVYHYFNIEKPWEMDEELYEDLKPFYNACREIKNKHPNLIYIKTKSKI